MISNYNLIRGYAKALFALANNLNFHQELLDLLKNLTNLLQLAKVKTLIKNHLLSYENKADLLITLINEQFILPQPADHELQNQQFKCAKKLFDDFIKLLAHNNHLLLIPNITDRYEKLYLLNTESLKIQITSAIPLTLNFRTAFTENLLKNFKKKILLSYTVDQSIIAGLIIKYNDQVIDYSLKGKLLQLQRILKHD